MTSEHLAAAVEVHTVAFPESRSTTLGKTFLRRMYQWFIRTNPDLALVAVSETDGVIGLIVGTRGEYTSRLFAYTLPHLVLSLLKRPRLLVNRNTFYEWRKLLLGCCKIVLKRRNAVEHTQQFVAAASLAALPAYRGIGVPLLLGFEQAASASDAVFIRATVHKVNTRVREMYRQLGYVEAQECGKGIHLTKQLKQIAT